MVTPLIGNEKQSETSRITSKYEIKSMYTEITGQYWIQNFCHSMGYPISETSRIYEDNQETTNIVLSDCITP